MFISFIKRQGSNDMKHKNIFLKWSVFFVLSAPVSQPLCASWGGELYNPKPSSQDIILPMPCDGKIVFRKVETEATGLYSDQAIVIGDQDVGKGRHKSNLVQGYIAGNFNSEHVERRYFLMGKYEITQLQYAAVMQDPSETCPQPHADSALPYVKSDWFDAIEFTKRYSLWLQQQYLGDNSIPLPKKDSALGFIRLPTEIEWEFSARGGLPAIESSKYLAATFFSSDESNQYAWSVGNNSADGKLRQIGLLKPNLLGLYDVLGNADEIVFDLFHLRHQRAESLHGETGGYIVRGGNYQDNKASLYSAKREEVPFYQDGKINKSSAVGFRVVVASSVITNENVNKLSSARDQLGLTEAVNVDTSTNELGYKIKDPVHEVNHLSQNMDNTALVQQLNELSVELNAQKIRYDKQLNRAAKEALRTAVILCQKLKDDNYIIERRQSLYEGYRCDDNPEKNHLKKCIKLSSSLQKKNKINGFNQQIFADSLINLTSFGLETVSRQRNSWLQEIKARGFTHIAPYPNIIFYNVEQYTKTGQVDKKKWSRECINL